MVLVKFILAVLLLLVFIQDYKERQVYWFLFPIIGIVGGVLFYKNTLPELFFNSAVLNIAFVLCLILVIFLYAKLKLKTNLLNTIGLGDLLLFLALSVSFSTISFMVVFIGALIFSLVLHIMLSKSQKTVAVPLAGYMSLFFLGCYACHWAGFTNLLYTL